MKVLVTGAGGQLGSEIRFIGGEFRGLEFSFVDKNALDICDFEAVQKALNGYDALINCAAYTAVDKAQSEVDKAFTINEKGALNLAKACEKFGVKLVHISTDYVFDGRAYQPMLENAPTAPLGVYGKSKLAGEKAILSQNLAHSCIIRTSWLWSEFGANFVKTIARLAKERDEISVVSDQIGSPTNARDLAQTICTILPKLSGIKGVEIFHYANAGVASWYDFAYEIVRLLERTYPTISCKVRAIKSSEYKTAAMRPFYSVLDTDKIKAHFGIEISHWRDSLAKANLKNLIDFDKINL